MKTDANATYPDQMDWYVMTELAGDILNEVMAFTAREELQERSKAEPDLKRIAKLHALLKGVQEINSDPENFQSLDKMNKIVSKYNAVLQQEKI